MLRRVKKASSSEPKRRNRSRQRALILEHLRASEAHPTAAQTHEALVRELPNLSLGTVYRNLEVLVSEGVIGEVPSAGGGVRWVVGTGNSNERCTKNSTASPQA
jgi:Fe2+ or Zn2+ uptake regulation protein